MNEHSLTDVSAFEIAGYRVEPSLLRVYREGREQRLEAKAMQVLVYLARQTGRAVSRDELEEQLWHGRIVTEDSVTNAIAKLRRALGDDARRPRVIETLPKSGYRLIAEVLPIGEVVAGGSAASLGAKSAERPNPLRRISLAVALAVAAFLALAVFLWGGWERGDVLPEESHRLSAKPAVAITPFENLGAVPEQNYFANGITADLITDLSKLRGLVVIRLGPASAGDVGGTGNAQFPPAPDVDYLIVGSVQRQGETLRINVQLIEAAVQRAVWGERYSGRIDDVFDLQDALTAAVIAALKVQIAPSERAYLASRPTASVAAYDEYLRGFEEHGRRNEADNLSARRHFERAIELDPTFARAYAGLALTYSREAIDGWTPTPERSLEVAAEQAERAATMDPSLPQVHFVTGQVALFRRQHARAIEAAERAIAADPSYADAYALLAWTLSYAGRPGKALAALDRAMRLNPTPPASYLEILGEIRFVQGRYDDAAANFQRVLGVNPGYLRARMWNAAALDWAGHRDLAGWEAVELLVASPGLSLARLDFAFPFRDPRMHDRLLEALRAAGLPK